MSELTVNTTKTNTIQHTGGTTGLTVANTGIVTASKEVIQTDYEIDMWRITADFSTTDATVTGWSRVDDSTFAKIGTGMTESSGLFTFPSTGLWQVTTYIMVNFSSNDGSAGVFLMVSPNSGTDWDSLGLIYEGGDSAANQNGSMTSLINVTNATTYRFRLESDSLDASNIQGQAEYTRSGILFERKGPSQ